MATRAARAMELVEKFPSGWSQVFLVCVGGGYGVYYYSKLGFLVMKGWFAEKDDKERRRELHIKEAVQARAAAAVAARREARDGRPAVLQADRHARQVTKNAYAWY